MNGMFPVENGLGCFADYETWKLYNQEIADFDTKTRKVIFTKMSWKVILKKMQIYQRVQEEKTG
jgi:hypothetical protein